MLTSVVGHWLIIQLKKVFMEKIEQPRLVGGDYE